MFAPGDKILFIFSDPGGAKPLLAFIKINALENYKVISDRVYPFYENFGIIVHPYKGNACVEVDEYKPDRVFTATSYRSNIEREFLVCAKERNIPCIAYIDHWTNIGERLMLSNNSCVYPDKVWVLDERAKQIALKDGLWEKRLHISGNPYHEWLKQWKPTVRKEEFLLSLGICNAGTKLLLFVPDPLTNINGFGKFGYDEITATKELCELKSQKPELFEDWKILVKPHPNQDIAVLKEMVKNRKRFIFADPAIDTNTCIYHSSLVLGFHSSALIEAKVLNRPVVRYIPSEKGIDPLKEENVGSIITSFTELENFMK